MADRIEIGWLFDFYGPLLTERQRKLLALYCNEDFSFRKSLPEKAFPDREFTTRFTARRVSLRITNGSLGCSGGIRA